MSNIIFQQKLEEHVSMYFNGKIIQEQQDWQCVTKIEENFPHQLVNFIVFRGSTSVSFHKLMCIIYSVQLTANYAVIFGKSHLVKDLRFSLDNIEHYLLCCPVKSLGHRKMYTSSRHHVKQPPKKIEFFFILKLRKAIKMK